jgi:hypothetical protein
VLVKRHPALFTRELTVTPGRGLPRDGPELAALDVEDGLADLVEAVHDERAVLDDGLVQQRLPNARSYSLWLLFRRVSA